LLIATRSFALLTRCLFTSGSRRLRAGRRQFASSSEKPIHLLAKLNKSRGQRRPAKTDQPPSLKLRRAGPITGKLVATGEALALADPAVLE
jgi:hypothetical protein